MEETREELSLETVESDSANTQQPDSFEVIDYVRELFLNSEEQKKTEKKKVRLMRVCVSLLGVITCVVVVSAALIIPKLVDTVSRANEALAIVQQIDVEAITEDADILMLQATETFDAVGEAVTVLNELDMESLNATIAELKTGVETFSELDIETLNTAIANLNATVEPFAKFFGLK